MCLSEAPEGVRITVKVIPKSSRSEILAPRNNALVVKLTSPPVDGKANKDLIRMIAKTLGVPQSSVEILKGHTSRDKILIARDVSVSEVNAALGVPR